MGATFDSGGWTSAPVAERATDGTASGCRVVDNVVGGGADGVGTTVGAGVASGFACKAKCCGVSLELLVR